MNVPTRLNSLSVLLTQSHIIHQHRPDKGIREPHPLPRFHESIQPAKDKVDLPAPKEHNQIARLRIGGHEDRPTSFG